MSLHEKEFLFYNIYPKEQFKNHTVLDDHFFMYTYLIYAFDLHGVSKFYKWSNREKTIEEYLLMDYLRQNAKNREEWRNGLITAKILIEIGRDEINESLEYLKAKAISWELHLEENRGKTNQKLLKEFISETFTHLKELKKQIKERALGENAFLFRKFQLFLFSKYAYLTAQKTIETFLNDNGFYSLVLCNEVIRFNEYYLAHILLRHYAQGIRNYDFIRSKSIHIGDFPFNEIHLKLENILLRIQNANILHDNYFDSDIVNLRFKYRGLQYFLGTKIDKNENESGKVPFRRVETFHLIEEQKMLNDINRDFVEKIVDDELILNIKR